MGVPTIRDIIKDNPSLYDYDYKWTDSENFAYIDEILEECGYKFADTSTLGEYNDIKGYLGCEVLPCSGKH